MTTKSMSIGERVLDGLGVSLVGMSITIAALVALAFFIFIMSRCVAAFAARGAGANSSGGAGSSGIGAGASTAAGAFESSASTQRFDEISGADALAASTGETDSRVIAAIMAAISASLGASPASFRVVSFRKTGQTAPAWNLRGRGEYFDSKM